MSIMKTVVTTQKKTTTQPSLPKVISDPLTASFDASDEKTTLATITIHSSFVSLFFDQIIKALQHTVSPSGFVKKEMPTNYIKQHYATSIHEHIVSLLLKMYILSYLLNAMRKHKISATGVPTIQKADLVDGQEGTFQFSITVAPKTAIFEWKHFPFKQPQRKNYRDLDRQVQQFTDAELQAFEEYQNKNEKTICPQDWVNFTISIHNEHMLHTPPSSFWFALGSDESDNPLREIFISRQRGDTFMCHHEALIDFLCPTIQQGYQFYVSIHDTIPYHYFCIDRFRKHFKLKTHRETHRKLIEVFSYRNDISQRRATVEAALDLMIAKHNIIAASHLIDEHKETLLREVSKIPDYNVYRVQKDFQLRINQLAEKQVREVIFIDQFAFQENIIASDLDIQNYLSFMIRPRMKEFIYFSLPSQKELGHDVPMITNEIRRFCLREKALNHIIYHLTRQ